MRKKTIAVDFCVVGGGMAGAFGRDRRCQARCQGSPLERSPRVGRQRFQ